MKKRIFCRLKRCLRDFKTKDHLCLFPDLLSFELSFQKGLSCPPVLGLGSLSLFSSFCLVEHNHLSCFYEKLKSFGSFGFCLSCPSFTWAALMIENFLVCPPILFGHFQSLRFFLCLSHLPPSVGCDPSQSYFQKNITRLKKGLQRIYFSLVKGLSMMAFLHLKCMHLGLVSLAFMRTCKVISHYSFK